MSWRVFYFDSSRVDARSHRRDLRSRLRVLSRRALRTRAFVGPAGLVPCAVDDLDRALDGKELIGEPSSPTPGIKVAMILHNGMPVELLEFAKP
jgi:hypothetical protein